MRLKEARKNARLSQQKVADYIGVSQNTYSYWENGKYNIDNESLKKLSELFDVSVDYLLGKEISKPAKALIPVLGTVQAGIPIEVTEDIIDYEELHPSMLEHGEEYFALQVKGDSMQPRMRNGDVVIVRKQSDVNHDDTAIVLVNGNEATIKRVLKSEAGIMLAPNNPAFEPKFYSNKDIAELPVVIMGKVIELRAKF